MGGASGGPLPSTSRGDFTLFGPCACSESALPSGGGLRTPLAGRSSHGRSRSVHGGPTYAGAPTASLSSGEAMAVRSVVPPIGGQSGLRPLPKTAKKNGHFGLRFGHGEKAKHGWTGLP